MLRKLNDCVTDDGTWSISAASCLFPQLCNCIAHSNFIWVWDMVVWCALLRPLSGLVIIQKGMKATTTVFLNTPPIIFFIGWSVLPVNESIRYKLRVSSTTKNKCVNSSSVE